MALSMYVGMGSIRSRAPHAIAQVMTTAQLSQCLDRVPGCDREPAGGPDVLIKGCSQAKDGLCLFLGEVQHGRGPKAVRLFQCCRGAVI
jgi:hypothetical protein